jgi:hypothetical protein
MKQRRDFQKKRKKMKRKAYVHALDVSMGKSYNVLYLDDLCLSEGEILHTKSGFSTLLQEIVALPETPNNDSPRKKHSYSFHWLRIPFRQPRKQVFRHRRCATTPNS